MNKFDFYRFIYKHSFLRYLAFGLKYRNNKQKLDEKMGLTKNSFLIQSFGKKNYGKIIYNITIDDDTAGFFALNRYVLDALYCADMMGFTPYISLIHTKYNNTTADTDNMFEYYYTQANGMSLDEVNNSFCVTNYKGEHRKWLEESFSGEDTLLCGYDFNLELISVLADISRKWLHLRKDVSNEIEKDILALDKSKKTIGIHFRGNAFKVGFYGHPIGLEIEDYYLYIDECISAGFEKVFIATDDETALNKLIARYNTRVIYYKDTIRSDDGVDVHDKNSKNHTNGYRLGYEVLRDMLTLASCDAFICGKSQVSYAVMIEKKVKNESFTYFKMIDHGLYDKDTNTVKKYLKSIK